ncbi:MAG: Hpt domain-containing protein [Bacteroides sp.]|nr:Hpt domain-containing protein [Bacteroides sp.]MCM1550472.1 Hpt domain-containing protein [Clostridium sp.]
MEQELKEQLKNVGVDVDTGLKRFMNNEALYMKFLNKFLTEPTYEQLQECIQKEDYPEAFRQAHTLKGVSANLSLTLLADSVSRLVELLRNCENPTEEISVKAKEYMNEITEKYLEVSSVLKENGK